MDQIVGRCLLTVPVQGALSARTIEFLGTGAMAYAFIPTPVCIIDPSRVDANSIQYAAELVGQWLFYFGTLASHSIGSDPTTGKILPTWVIHKVCPGHKLALARSWAIALEALPLKTNRQAILVFDKVRNQHLQDYLGAQATQMVAYNSQKKVNVVWGDLTNGWGALLSARNISRDSLPVSLGGTLPDLFHLDMIRMRMSIEDCMAAAPPITNARLSNHYQPLLRLNDNDTVMLATANKKRRNLLLTDQPPNQEKEPQQLQSQSDDKASNNQSAYAQRLEWEEKERKRKNAMYQKLWVHKHKAKTWSLQPQCDDALAAQNRLKAEYDRLDGLLEQAKTVVSMYEHQAADITTMTIPSEE